MTDTTTNGCALHDTSLPNIQLDMNLDVFRFYRHRMVAPKNPTLLWIDGANYLMWRRGEAFALELRVHPLGKTPSRVVSTHQGQKIAIGSSRFFIVDIVDGTPVLRDC